MRACIAAGKTAVIEMAFVERKGESARIAGFGRRLKLMTIQKLEAPEVVELPSGSVDTQLLRCG